MGLDTQIDSTVDKALSILDGDDGAGSSADMSPEAKILERLDAGDGAPDQEAGETASDTTAEVVEAPKPAEGTKPDAATEAPIEAPASWKAEWQEQFKALPPAQQKIIAERESERERGLAKSQQESAEARKAAEVERTAVQAERKTYVEGLTKLIDVANMLDPVIAEGRKTDWGKALRDDPFGAPAKKYDYEQRENQLNMLVSHRDQVEQKARYEAYQRGHQELKAKLPEIWTDDGKRTAFQSEFAKYLEGFGYSPQESSSIADHRAILVGHKAMQYDKLMAEQKRIADTKVKPLAAKVVRAQSNDVTSSKDVRAEALTKRAMRTGRTDDIAEAVLSQLG